MQSQIIIDNLLISYTETGNSGGMCLIFLHGWRSEAGVWRQVVASDKLQVTSRMYAMDLPGFGKSQNPHPDPLPSAAAKAMADKEGKGALQSQAWGIGEYAQIVAKFIQKLNLPKVVVVGHSFGGRVGIKLAAEHTDLISKLVLVDSAGFTMDVKKKNLMNAGARIVKPFFKPKFMQPLRKKIYKKIGAEDYLETPRLQQTFIKTVSEDLSEDMKKIKCPTLIITGADDKDTPVEFGQRMNSLILNSKFITLEHAGHFSFLDKPEEFVEALEKFIA